MKQNLHKLISQKIPVSMANKVKESKKEYVSSLKTFLYYKSNCKIKKKFEKLNNTVDGMLVSLSSK